MFVLNVIGKGATPDPFAVLATARPRVLAEGFACDIRSKAGLR